MADRFPGGVISKTPPTVSGPAPGTSGTASGVWTLSEVLGYVKAGVWTGERIPLLELFTFGRNNNGQLGIGDVTNRLSPVQVGALGDWSQVATGSAAYHSVTVKTDGTLWAWGLGNNGRLGLGLNIDARSSPVQVGVLTNWYESATGSTFTVSLKNDGTLWSFGANTSGALGDGTRVNKSSPVQIGALTDWSHVACGNLHVATVKFDGTLWTWGANGSGQLGQNTGFNAYRSSPVQVGTLTDWSQVAGGLAHTAAVKTGGTIWTWGRPSRGQLGLNSNTVYRSSPTQVGALTNWAQVACGALHTVSVKTNGTLWAWGYNTRGELGQNTVINRSSPVQIGSLSNWSQVACGGSHTVAVKTDGTLWAWGKNDLFGNLGDGTVINRSSPVQIGALTNWTQVSAGAYHTLAIYQV